jgi:hypothetical protein
MNEEKLVFVLMRRLMDVLRDSGANCTEAACALRATEAMIQELGLPLKPTLSVETRR